MRGEHASSAAIGSLLFTAVPGSRLEELNLFPFLRETTTINPAPWVYEIRTGAM
jgi:hypothetical protein